MNSIQLTLSHDLDNLNKWLISNKLTLNTSKTTYACALHLALPHGRTRTNLVLYISNISHVLAKEDTKKASDRAARVLKHDAEAV